MQKFEIGDIVQLRSGGPDMTICGVKAQDTYFCSWFAPSSVYNHSDGSVHGGAFHANMLSLIEPLRG